MMQNEEALKYLGYREIFRLRPFGKYPPRQITLFMFAQDEILLEEERNPDLLRNHLSATQTHSPHKRYTEHRVFTSNVLQEYFGGDLNTVSFSFTHHTNSSLVCANTNTNSGARFITV